MSDLKPEAIRFMNGERKERWQPALSDGRRLWGGTYAGRFHLSRWSAERPLPEDGIIYSKTLYRSRKAALRAAVRELRSIRRHSWREVTDE